MTPQQITTLKGAALADPTAAGYITNGNDPQLADPKPIEEAKTMTQAARIDDVQLGDYQWQN